MPGALSLLFHQMSVLWKHFGINQKVSIVLALMTTIAVISGIMYWSAKPDYRLLFTGLSLQDAARGRERLEEERIPVQIRDHGQALYVPAAEVYRARLMLATDGLPQDVSAGFELFEEPKFGLTEFAQQVNYQRALQGELERTISAVDGVKGARIMLVMPRDQLFASEKDKAARASIMLSLARGIQLEPEQIQSIGQLVSASVPGLSQENVTITDQKGRMLSAASSQADPILESSSRQIDWRRTVEESLAKKAQDMLDLSFGAGQAIVRVSADIDFRQIERHNETFDAEGRVLFRETIKSEKTTDPVRTPGSGTARVAVGDPASSVTMEKTAMGESKSEDIDSEYHVPSGRETILDHGGKINRLSVSVSIAKNAEPRSQEEVDNIKRLVISAVGAVTTSPRLDSVEIVEMAFKNQPLAGDAQTPWPWWQQLPFSLFGALRSLAGMLLLLTLYILSRRTLRQLSIERETVGTPVSMLANGSMHMLPSEGQDLSTPESENPTDSVSRLAEQNPNIIATWIDHTVRGKG